MTNPTQTMKPMLAGKADVASLNFPVIVSPKLDGIRAVVKDLKVMSRSLKEIPNNYVQQKLGNCFDYEGLDGELILGDPTADDVYRKSNSAFMSHDGEPGFTFFVFDLWNRDLPFSKRYDLITDAFINHPFIQAVPHTTVYNAESLLETERHYLEKGYEGLMIRDPEGRYKFGRSTTKEGTLLKLKRFTDSEAIIIGFEELMHNANEAKKNALGRTERSSHKENQVPMNMLGALKVRDLGSGIDFNIGTGFTEAQRKLFWAIRSELVGKLVKYKHFEIGVKEAPRHPVFVGFRDRIDT